MEGGGVRSGLPGSWCFDLVCEMELADVVVSACCGAQDGTAGYSIFSDMGYLCIRLSFSHRHLGSELPCDITCSAVLEQTL